MATPRGSDTCGRIKDRAQHGQGGVSTAGVPRPDGGQHHAEEEDERDGGPRKPPGSRSGGLRPDPEFDRGAGRNSMSLGKIGALHADTATIVVDPDRAEQVRAAVRAKTGLRLPLAQRVVQDRLIARAAPTLPGWASVVCPVP